MNKSSLHNELLSKQNKFFKSAQNLNTVSNTDIHSCKSPLQSNLNNNNFNKDTIIPIKNIDINNNLNKDKHVIHFKKYIEYNWKHIMSYILFQLILTAGLFAINTYFLIKYTNINYIT